jgi:UDP-GlcNAc:undecaprenyl-phosphate/decaprenyl-phosphate GlcNAc-1-phosphate transferase
MKLNIMSWFDPIVLIFMFVALALNCLIAYLWYKKFYRNLGLITYKAIQRIHLNETPRLGGLIFIILLVLFTEFSHDNQIIHLLKTILICLIPIIIVGVKEDLFHNVDPAIRLLALFFASWLFISNFIGSLPILTGIPLIQKLIMFQGGVAIFYILSIVAVANGMNLIDGVNGLCGAVALSSLSALLFLSYKTGDTTMLSLIFSLILLLIPFLLVNYPFGLIFLGDLGAYSLGFIMSILTIIFFGRHPEISPWAAMLILSYPVTEVIFSLLRRMITGKRIYHPDKSHLHLKLFLFFRSFPAFKKTANAIVTPILSLLWLFPLISITWTYHKEFFIWVSIALFNIFYSFLYIVFQKITKRKS